MTDGRGLASLEPREEEVKKFNCLCICLCICLCLSHSVCLYFSQYSLQQVIEESVPDHLCIHMFVFLITSTSTYLSSSL